MFSFKTWLSNAAIQKKFIPLQFFIILSVIFVSLFSIFSVMMVNVSSQNLIEINVRHKEQLSDIIRNMYVCRVLGRDILFAEEDSIKQSLYDEYIVAFEDLDQKMADYTQFLEGERLNEFNEIIEQKNIYKDSMILSADIWLADGDYDEALYALQVVTPIANEFFGTIDEYSLEEEALLEEALERNDSLVFSILISGTILCVAMILAVLLFIKFFSKNLSSSLIALEKSMSEIAETGNMKVKFPSYLYTKDEVGRITTVANKMKDMLLEYSFQDTLTGGYNAKAYHEELTDIFSNETEEKTIWCVISDMNNLKQINDNLGHLEGDNAIRNSYTALSEVLNTYGKTFRLGGDEFVSLLEGCTREELDAAITNVTDQINKLTINSEYKFSLAIGYDEFVGKSSLEFHEFFALVDKKMYDNKLKSKQARLHARVVELEE